MEILKNILSFGIMASMLFLSGCNTEGTPSDTTSESTISSTETSKEDETRIVKISSLTAGEANLVAPAEKALNELGDDSSSEEESESEDKIQYIVIDKSVKEITFTIKLDNYEAADIDAVRLYCDDENAQIWIDGEYKPLAYESDKTRVVKWASEDIYERTYYIRLSSEEYLNTLSVKDIRLAGHSKFQSKEVNVDNLGKNELRIYKMEKDSGFKWNIIANNINYYEFTVEPTERVQNLSVEGDRLIAKETSYKMTKDGTVKIKYDYTFEDNFSTHIEVSRDISLLKMRISEKDVLKSNGLNIAITGEYSDTITEIPVYQYVYPYPQKTYNLLGVCVKSPSGESWITEGQESPFQGIETVYFEVLNTMYIAGNGIYYNTLMAIY